MGAVIHSCDVAAEDLGPLLLGQLAPSRAREVGRRVAACPLCAAEAAALAPVVAALRAYPPPEVEVREPAEPAEPAEPLERPAAGPVTGLETVLAAVASERRRRSRGRALLAAAAAVVLLGGAATAVRVVTQEPAPDAVQVRLAGDDGELGEATLAARQWGTAIRLEVDGLDPAARYGVWLAAADGGRLPAGSFRPTAAGSVELRLSSALPLDAGRVLGVTQLPGASSPEPVDVLEAQLSG